MCMRRSGASMSRTMPAREGESGEGGRAQHSSSRMLRAKKGLAPWNEFERFEAKWRRLPLMTGRPGGIKNPFEEDDDNDDRHVKWNPSIILFRIFQTSHP